MSIEHPGMVMSMGKLTFSEINLAQCHLVHYEYLRSEDVFNQLHTKCTKSVVNYVER
jgi:hypothetical protein